VLNWVNDSFTPPRPRLVRPLVGFLLAGTTPFGPSAPLPVAP
jgi:hypothetical protein